jgi:DNA-binding transcriptional regulator GbsR (MarR family)
VTSSQTTTTTTTTISGHDAKEIEKRREKIAKLEREVAEHPDREHLREDLADERAKLERLERDIQERH